ncbi:transcriptional regulator GcvA [Sorangium sp. So ce542]|uniref:transcriptional regulator GcvA n=1 Tax=Sorangium sp. So ce542 TaxID=3133316 RepID=UPI003F631597
MRRLPPLTALRAFEAAARHLSFKRAARELGVTPTAISHQVRLLEETIGVRLFERHARQVVATREAQRLYPVLRDGFDAFARAIDELTARRARRGITLSATTAFTAKWLVPRVAAFREACPGLDLRLHASDEPVDLAAGEADAAIRYGRGPYPGLAAEALIADRFAPVCSPGLAVRRPEDLRRAPLLHFEWRRVERDTPTWRLWLERAGLPGVRDDGGTTFSDEAHAIQAAIAGQGVALLSLVLVADDLESGALVQPFGPALDGYRYHFVHLPGAAAREEIAALRGWLAAATTGERPRPMR